MLQRWFAVYLLMALPLGTADITPARAGGGRQRRAGDSLYGRQSNGCASVYGFLQGARPFALLVWEADSGRCLATCRGYQALGGNLLQITLCRGALHPRPKQLPHPARGYTVPGR